MSDSDSRTHRIEGTDRLLMQTIKDQASDLEHGWREAIQNGIDSPGSAEVRLEYDHEHTVVSDDGDGVDLDESYGIDLLTNLGESSKADDENTIGEFGIGKGQIVAKARTLMASGETALLIDIDAWGLEVIEVATENAVSYLREHGTDSWAEYVAENLDGYVDGFLIVMDHYDDEVPAEYSYRWNIYEDRITDRFKYAELANDVQIYLNDEVISEGSITEGDAQHGHYEVYKSPETGRVHIGVRHNYGEDLDVYSNGVFVKSIESRGLSGTIVTEKNLDLNFARNEIKSGCEKFSAIQERLDDIRIDLFTSMPEGRLNRDARKFIAEEMLLKDRTDEFKDIPIFETATEGAVSLTEIQENDAIGRAEKGDKASDVLSEVYGEVVLAENDSASRKLLDNLDNDDSIEDVDTFDPSERAENLGVHVRHEEQAMSALTPTERNKLCLARLLAERMGDHKSIDESREVHYGVSDIAKQWTDGTLKIVITENTTSSNAWAEFLPEIYRALCHEYAHIYETKEGCPNHGSDFNERYREIVDGNIDALTEVISMVRENGVKETAMRAPKY